MDAFNRLLDSVRTEQSSRGVKVSCREQIIIRRQSWSGIGAV